MAIKSVQAILPEIYAYSTPGVSYHDGWLKLGYTEQTADARVKQQTKTAGIRVQIEWHEFAIYKERQPNGEYLTFTDDDFKAYLDSKGVNHQNDFGENGEAIGDEWYQITPEQAHDYFEEFSQKPSPDKQIRAYHLRSEQTEAVKDTKAAVTENNETEYLWNAKPRFGKCLSCYDFIRQIDARRVLIVTNRPSVGTSWHDDYKKYLGRDSGYFFVSHVQDLKDEPDVIDYPQYKADDDARKAKEESEGIPYEPHKMIYFASLQDIKQSSYFGGEYVKLRELTTIQWDVLVVDESHEGVDTDLTQMAFTQIHRKFTLYLSGTPFKAIKNEKFDSDEIYNWTYVSEQEAKERWNGTGTNPYLQMPKLNMLTYRLSNILNERPDLSDDNDCTSADRLNEFFKTVNGRFVNDADIDHFLDVISSDPKYPFGSDENRRQLAHTFWLLPGDNAASTTALKEKLNSHPVFGSYKVVIAAGEGEQGYKTSFQAVTDAIKKYPKTITLSVKQLTTGVTIPQWTGVLMLSERNSPAEYMQASFRVQNPYIFSRHDDMTGKDIFYRKTDAYVFDFNPEHTLDIVEQFANNLYSSTAGGRGDDAERRHNVEQLLKYLPVTGENDSGTMEPLSPDDVLIIPRKLKAQEVVRHGFMYDDLFQNITNVFHMTGNDIVSRLPVTDGHATKSSTLSVTEEDIRDMHLNSDGDVEITDEETREAVQNDIPAETKEDTVAVVKKDVQKAVADVNITARGVEKKSERESISEAFTKKIQEETIKKMREAHPEQMTKTAERKIKQDIAQKAKDIVKKNYDRYTIESESTAADIHEALPVNATAEQKREAEDRITEAREQAKDRMTENLISSVSDMVDSGFESGEKTIMETAATAKKDDKLTEFKKHLKGFTRTIPSFLMAFGDDDFTLDKIEKKIPADVFEEVTSITLDEFKVLRDDCKYFNATVFNEAVKVFMKKRRDLADYFDDSAIEDIFDYIPPQQTNQIYTPKNVVSEMVSYLEQENPGCYDDPDKTFIDPYMKSGLYITELVKRLYRSDKMKELYPDDKERLQHILEEQVYGLAPTKIIYRIATNFIFDFTKQNGVDIKTDHFRCLDALPYAQGQMDMTLAEKLDEVFGKDGD